MRNAKCVGLKAPVTILGSKRTVTITEGWQGDLDEVIGETPVEHDAHGKVVRAEPVTIAAALGEPLLVHFDVEQQLHDVVALPLTETVDDPPSAAPRARGRRRDTAPADAAVAPQSQE